MPSLLEPKLCECGCGYPTAIAKSTYRTQGIFRGKPLRFIKGHYFREDPMVRALKKVKVSGSCWNWIGAVNDRGYAEFQLEKGKKVRAHKFIYENIVGKVEIGLQLDHLCRNPSCVNPFHLEPVTARENTLRGVGPSALNAKKTHCPKGHEYTKENIVKKTDGGRGCRKCRNEYGHKYRARRKARGQI